MSWKVAFLISLGVLLISNLFWGYVVVDSGVTVTHLKDQTNDQYRRLEVLSNLLPKVSGNLDRNKFLEIVGVIHPDSESVFEKGSDVIVQGVTFSFSQGQLTSVEANY